MKNNFDYFELLIIKLHQFFYLAAITWITNWGKPRIITLRVLLRKKACSLKELSKSIAISSSSLSPLIEKLVKQGFIIRVQNSKNRREVLISLTNLGEKYIVDEISKRIESINNILNILNEKEKNNIVKSMITIYNILDFKLFNKANIQLDEINISELFELFISNILEYYYRTINLNFSGLKKQSYWLLAMLFLNNNLSITELSKRLGLTISSTSSIVDNLIKNGLIEKYINSIDRRVTICKLSKKGNKYFLALLKKNDSLLNSKIENLKESERLKLYKAINILDFYIEKLNPYTLNNVPIEYNR